MDKDFFRKNIVAIIPESGEIIGVERRPSETYHSEVFERIDKEIIPNYLNDFVLVPEAYGGYDYATISAANGNAIIVPTGMGNSSSMIVAVPSIITEKQKESVEILLRNLDKSVVYILECKRKKQVLTSLDKSDVRTLLYDKNSIKTLDDLIDLEIKEENSIGGKK